MSTSAPNSLWYSRGASHWKEAGEGSGAVAPGATATWRLMCHRSARVAEDRSRVCARSIWMTTGSKASSTLMVAVSSEVSRARWKAPNTFAAISSATRPRFLQWSATVALGFCPSLSYLSLASPPKSLRNPTAPNQAAHKKDSAVVPLAIAATNTIFSSK